MIAENQNWFSVMCSNFSQFQPDLKYRSLCSHLWSPGVKLLQKTLMEEGLAFCCIDIISAERTYDFKVGLNLSWTPESLGLFGR